MSQASSSNDNNGTGERKYECPVCYEKLLPPIYQCYNGHLVCNTCIVQLRNCPVCRERLPKRRIRNLEVENITSAQIVPCPYEKRGCKEMLKYDLMEKHKTECRYSKTFCSFLGFNECEECISATDILFHLIERHQLHGEFIAPGEYVDIIQMGSEPHQIEQCKVEWRPIYIVQGDLTFFFRTKLEAESISWMLSVLNSGDKTNGLVGTIHFQADESETSSVSWKGQVKDLNGNFVLKNCFSLPSRVLKGISKWTMRVQLSKGDEPSSLPKMSSNTIVSQAREIDQSSPGSTSGPGRHEGVECDGCHQPVYGQRFKCTHCTDYDLCATCCIDKNIHEHHVFVLARNSTLPVVQKLRKVVRAVEDMRYHEDVESEDSVDDDDDSHSISDIDEDISQDHTDRSSFMDDWDDE